MDWDESRARFERGLNFAPWATSVVIKPVLQALVLAERIFEDKVTGQKIIAGTFNAINYGKRRVAEVEKPDGNKETHVRGGVNAGSPWVYINLTEIHGEIAFTLQYIDLKNHKVLLSTEFSIKCSSPLQNREVVVPLPDLPVPHPGTYALELLTDEYPLGALRIEARCIDVEENENEHD